MVTFKTTRTIDETHELKLPSFRRNEAGNTWSAILTETTSLTLFLSKSTEPWSSLRFMHAKHAISEHVRQDMVEITEEEWNAAVILAQASINDYLNSHIVPIIQHVE